MNKNDNILRKWWFGFVITPLFTISFSFIPGWLDIDEKLLSWIVLIIIAFACEIYILYTNKIKYRMMHYVFILSSFMVTIFISFMISKFLNLNIKWEWVKNIVLMIISVVVLFIVKTFIWVFMSLKQRELVVKDLTIDDLRIKVSELEDENQRLKEKLEPKDDTNGDTKTFWSVFGIKK
ncbi:hypothetical protein [Candidatus Mycoplasma mahonii]|uniref:hypothetical protein n=1 Tax=Candidatus Mycoplasma mahonii TaxID=3004105 RepID=UPI0026EC7CF8|nr:hypothetical protein [Candidatus Mycoplasma mahonii]WKX02440.1 hypothetical protein O3I44_03550 [Candidatus Mycoplasma mahonii]